MQCLPSLSLLVGIRDGVEPGVIALLVYDGTLPR